MSAQAFTFHNHFLDRDGCEDSLSYVSIITEVNGETLVHKYDFWYECEDSECVTRLLDRINEAGEINLIHWRKLNWEQKEQYAEFIAYQTQCDDDEAGYWEDIYSDSYRNQSAYNLGY